MINRVHVEYGNAILIAASSAGEPRTKRVVHVLLRPVDVVEKSLALREFRLCQADGNAIAVSARVVTDPGAVTADMQVGNNRSIHWLARTGRGNAFDTRYLILAVTVGRAAEGGDKDGDAHGFGEELHVMPNA